MEYDYVCGMEVDPGTAPARTEYAGDTYYFCSEACKEKFEVDPERYVARDETSLT